MKVKVVESSLNLRRERGKKNSDYFISQEVADKQLEFKADIYCNVEYMECNDGDYLKAFSEAGYKSYKSVDNEVHRGILCEIKNEYEVQVISKSDDPHMQHLRVAKGDDYVDLIILRILVAGSDEADYIDRNQQWKRVLDYMGKIEDKSRLILIGDFNHGVISSSYGENHARRFFNYQMIVEDLKDNNIELFPIDGFSYREYMKIDHIATGKNIEVVNATYQEIFKSPYIIGIPDHNFIVAEIKCA